MPRIFIFQILFSLKVLNYLEKLNEDDNINILHRNNNEASIKATECPFLGRRGVIRSKLNEPGGSLLFRFMDSELKKR